MKNQSVSASVTIFLMGVAVGAGIGLLFAPQSGRRTRRQIVRGVEEIGDYLEDLGEELIEKGRDLVERGRMAVDETVEGIEKKVRKAAS